MSRCNICNNLVINETYKRICSGCISLISRVSHQCRQCGIQLEVSKEICGHCLISPPVFSSVQYVSDYATPIDKWVMSLKFGKNITITRLMAELLVEKLEHIKSDAILTAVPLHKARLRSRGYNQSFEIAKELAKLSGFALKSFLKRSKNTAMQAELKLKDRAKNVRNAFSCDYDLTGKTLVLIDDVMTSGSTINECAKTLKKAGASDIKVLVFARKS